MSNTLMTEIMESNEIIKIFFFVVFFVLFGCFFVFFFLISINRLTDVKEYIPIGNPVQLNLYTITIKE